jgi:putative ABC transport system permease protein
LVGTWYRQRLSLEDGTTFVTGIAELNPGWELQGSWPLDHAQAEAVVGAALAERFSLRPGSLLGLDVLPHHSATVAVRGILRTGGEEDRQVFVPLAWLQRVANRPRSFRRLQVSALVSPEDEFAQRDPRSMTPAEYDRWYCTPYVSSIAHQIEEVLGDTEARPIQRVAQAETSILSRVERLLALVSVAALLGAVLAVLSTMTTGLLERRSEIAVMKALGADPWLLAAFFLGEALLLGLLGGAFGYFGGWAGARLIAASVFGASLTPPPVLLPAMLMLAVVIAVGGTLVPLRMVERTHPALVLKER